MISYSKFILSIMAFSLTLTFYAKEKPFIRTQTKKIIAERVTSDTKGNLTYKVKTLQMKLKPSEYIYARVPAPTEIVSAMRKLKSKKYRDAAAALKKCYDKYRFLGWDVYCLYYTAFSLNEEGKKEQAIKELLKITELPKDPKKTNNYYNAMKLLATLYIDTKQYDKAETKLSSIGQVEDTDIFAFVNNSRGDMMLKKGKSKDAILMYLRTIMLIKKDDNKKERPEALAKVIKILKEENNNRHLDFEKMLKADYPDFSL